MNRCLRCLFIFGGIIRLLTAPLLAQNEDPQTLGSNPNPIRTLDDIRRALDEQIDFRDFQIERTDRRIKIPLATLPRWIEEHPLYKARMAAPDSPQKALFVLLAERAKLNVNLIEGSESFPRKSLILPAKNDEDGFLLALAYAAQTLEHSHSKIKGQHNAILATAKALGANLSPADQIKLMAIQRFTIATLALGIQSQSEFDKRASNFKLDDLLEAPDISKVTAADRKSALSLIVNQTHSLHVPIFLSQRMHGLWSYWDEYDYDYFNAEGLERGPNSALELSLVQRLGPGRDDEESEKLYEDEFILGTLKHFNIERALGKKAERLKTGDREAVMALVKLQLAPDFPSYKETQARAKKEGISLVAFSPADFEKIYLETIEAAAEHIHSIRGRIALEGQGWKSGKDRIYYFDESFPQIILNAIEKSVAESKMPSFHYNSKSEISKRQQINVYLVNNFAVYSKQIPMIQNHLKRLQKTSELKLKRTLEESEIESIQNIYASMLGLMIANHKSGLEMSWPGLTPKMQEAMSKLGLAPTANILNPWHLSNVAVSEPEDKLEIKPEIEELRTHAKNLGIFSNEVGLASLLGKTLPSKMSALLREQIPKDYLPYGRNGRGEAWISPALALKNGELKQIQNRMNVLATIFVFARPKNAMEFSILLREPAKVALYVKDAPRFSYSDDLVESLYEDFLATMKEALVSHACATGLKAAHQATGK